jgi:hypothetical protein
MDPLSALTGAAGTFLGDFLYALFLYLFNIILGFLPEEGFMFPGF